jgi:ParB-like nuclease domain
VRAKSAPSQREGAPLETLPSKVASRWFEFVDLEAIRANPNNAREHDTRQIAKLTQSIAKFGFLSPVANGRYFLDAKLSGRLVASMTAQQLASGIHHGDPMYITGFSE